MTHTGALGLYQHAPLSCGGGLLLWNLVEFWGFFSPKPNKTRRLVKISKKIITILKRMSELVWI